MSPLDRQILLIDADVAHRTRVKDFLIVLGYRNIKESGRVKEALDILNADHLDCIVANWELPVANGNSLLKLIRSQKRFHHILFILMTDAKSDAPELKIIQSKKLGVDGFLLKPFDESTLEKMIAKIRPKILGV